jgi:hypothetical protein
VLEDAASQLQMSGVAPSTAKKARPTSAEDVLLEQDDAAAATAASAATVEAPDSGEAKAAKKPRNAGHTLTLKEVRLIQCH